MKMDHIELEQALALLLEGAAPVGEETAPLEKLPLGRALAQPVTAGLDQPPFPRSPLDGYALHAADSRGAGRKTPVVLSVAGCRYAGDAPMTRPVARGYAVRVMTGAPIPPGCDCVIPQEKTDGGESRVALYAALAPGQNYVPQGEDFRRGDCLLPRGYVLDPAALGVAAGAGLTQVTVFRRPRTAVIATGDELLTPGQALTPGKIYNSNLYYLQSRLIQLGGEVTFAAQVGDDAEAIAQALRHGAREADLVLTTGGVSVGRRDLLPQVMEGLGARRIFHGVAMKPGSPALFTRLGAVPILSLSGNPFAAAVTLEVLARPLLNALSGRREEPRLTAVLSRDFPKGAPVRRFVRGRCEGGVLTLPQGHSSGQLASLTGCNCLGELPAGRGAVPAGSKIPVIML